jgi:hypothetical protein
VRAAIGLFCAVCFFSGAAPAEEPITVTVSGRPAAAVIPPDFLGLSFGMKSLLPNSNGGHFFSPTNTPLVTLFQNLGIKHLRVGGTTVESPPTLPIPGEREIDDLFAFVQAAHVQKVIYSLRLLETNAAQHYAVADAAVAKYIWEHYRTCLDCFAIGNEPDRQGIYQQDCVITDFSSYLTKWRQFAAAVTNAAPGAKFAGPDAGSGNVNWTTRFAHEERDAGLLGTVAEHFYVGGAGKEVPAGQALEAMLSPAWLDRNQKLDDRMAAPVLADGLRYRFTEANDHYSGGVADASDTFAGALWALDFLHWWAENSAGGVNFHNTQWAVNDVITMDSNHRLKINPKGYGLAAFTLGSQGSPEPVAISNRQGMNVTAYAVRNAQQHFLTLINKEHGAGAREAGFTIIVPGSAQKAESLVLSAPNGNVGAKSGVLLGGAGIDADGRWQGKWNSQPASQPGQFTLKLPPASAVVVRIPAP